MTVIDNLMDKIETFNEDNDLKHGNTETMFEPQFDCIRTTIEGHNHTTLTIDFSMEDIKEMEDESQFLNVLERRYRERIRDFDVDETFTELWSASFGEHNNFTPSLFLNIFEDDAEHFSNIEYKENVK